LLVIVIVDSSQLWAQPINNFEALFRKKANVINVPFFPLAFTHTIFPLGKHPSATTTQSLVDVSFVVSVVVVVVVDVEVVVVAAVAIVVVVVIDVVVVVVVVAVVVVVVVVVAVVVVVVIVDVGVVTVVVVFEVKLKWKIHHNIYFDIGLKYRFNSLK